MTVQAGIFFAVLCALATNLGFLCKYRGACAAPEVTWRHPLRSAAGLWRQRWFAVGMLVACVAWLLHVVSMSLAPLSIVQAVIAGAVGHHGAIALVSPWLLTCVAASVVAFYASARGFQQGEAVPVITVTSAAANVSAIVGGIVVFGDPMRSDPVGLLLETFAFLLVVAAAWLTPAPLRAASSAAAA